VQRSKPRGFFSRLFGVFGTSRVLNLRPKLYVRHPWLVFGGFFAAVFILVLGSRQLFTRAEVADFYPSTCLGEWENPSNAQGEPETFGMVAPVFNASNSAVYAASSSQIFCGGFLPPDYDTKGEIENVVLTLVWQVEDVAAELGILQTEVGSIVSTSSTIDITTSTPLDDARGKPSVVSPSTGSGDTEVEPPPPAATTVTTATTSLEAANAAITTETTSTPTTTQPEIPENPTSTIEEPPLEEPPTNSSSTTTSFLKPNYLSFLWFWNINPVFAAEEATSTHRDTQASASSDPQPNSSPQASSVQATSTEVVSGQGESAPLPVNETTTPAAAEEPPVAETQINQSTSSPAQISEESLGNQATSTITSSGNIALPSVIEASPPDDNFLQVSYSVNGTDWIELAKVSPENWQNLTVTVPVTTWEEKEQLQIKIAGIPTSLAEIPKVYLDGILVETHYAISVFGTQPGGSNASSQVDTTSAPVLKLEEAPNPFPDLPRVILLPALGVDVPVEDFRAGDSPVIRIDVDNLTP